MGPCHEKKVECVVIKDVHTVVLYLGLYAFAGAGPSDQASAGRGITMDHGIQGF